MYLVDYVDAPRLKLTGADVHSLASNLETDRGAAGDHFGLNFSYLFRSEARGHYFGLEVDVIYSLEISNARV